MILCASRRFCCKSDAGLVQFVHLPWSCLSFSCFVPKKLHVYFRSGSCGTGGPICFHATRWATKPAFSFVCVTLCMWVSSFLVSLFSCVHHYVLFSLVLAKWLVKKCCTSQEIGGVRKYSFCFRITNVWNSLPLPPVITALSVNSFKNRLDKHWTLQELRYDWEAELSGTGSRSRVEFWVLRVYQLPLYVLNNDMGIEALRLRT